MDIEKFEKDLTVFTFSQHQDFLTYLQLLREFNYTFEDVGIYVKAKRKELAKAFQQAWTMANVVTKTCSECQASMQLFPINFTPATLTGEDSKSVWLCPGNTCMHTIYNKETVEELRSKGGT